MVKSITNAGTGATYVNHLDRFITFFDSQYTKLINRGECFGFYCFLAFENDFVQSYFRYSSVYFFHLSNLGWLNQLYSLFLNHNSLINYYG
ncbi:hypothetical protein CDL62_12135 [Alkalitalea saponilacus]|nr:hypothetical protein CDL62_12135 [Alkalitalea saponilacus]